MFPTSTRVRWDLYRDAVLRIGESMDSYTNSVEQIQCTQNKWLCEFVSLGLLKLRRKNSLHFGPSLCTVLTPSVGCPRTQF